MRPFFPLVFAALLAGCTSFPQLEEATSDQARAKGFPRLVPLEQLLDGAQGGRLTPDVAQSVLGRVADLRARAEALRQREVIEPEVRAAIAKTQAKKPKPADPATQVPPPQGAGG